MSTIGGGAAFTAVLPAACLLSLALLGLLVRLQSSRVATRRASLERRLAALRPTAGIDEFDANQTRHQRSLAFPRFIAITLARADLRPRRDRLAVWAATATAVAAVTALAWGPLAVAAAEIGVLVLPVLTIHVLAARRMRRFVDGLPGLLDTLRQLVAAGSSLQQGLARAVATLDADTQRYLVPLERRLQNGTPVPEAIDALATALGCRELHMIAIAVRVNLAQGGRMAPILRGLATALRDQQRVSRELRATTAETRWSAIILGSLPPVAALAICTFNPAYARFFFDTPTGHRLLLVATALQIAGVLLMRRILRVAF